MRFPTARGEAGSRALRASMLGLVAISAAAGSARAQISYVETYKTGQYQQTGDGNSLSLTGYYFAANLYLVNPNDFNTATLDYPGPGTPATLSVSTPTVFSYTTSFFADRAAIDAAFPMGTYTFTASNGGPGVSTTLSYTSDDYSQTLPYLTGTDYSALQGMDPSRAFTFHLSPFTNGTQATFSYIFLTITDLTTSTQAFDDGFLSPTTTAVTMSANTLKAGDTYQYDLIYSNRDIASSVPPGAIFAPQLGFDYRTTGTFTPQAAVPEPASIGLLAPALVVPGLLALRRRTKGSPSIPA